MLHAHNKYDRFVINKSTGFMQGGKLAQKNFNLLEQEFLLLKKELQSGNESLFKQVFLSQFEYSLNYVIKKYNAEYDVAYDITMNTLLEFRNRIIKDKISYGNLSFLFTQMCSQRYQRAMKSNNKVTKISKHIERSLTDTDDSSISSEMIEQLDIAMDKMGENCKDILMKFYYENMSYKSLESVYNKNASALRKQKERCVTYLKMLIRKSLNQ